MGFDELHCLLNLPTRRNGLRNPTEGLAARSLLCDPSCDKGDCLRNLAVRCKFLPHHPKELI
eukprot:NODE_16493_length_310_cov_0.965517_g15326_i0.p3 GENE.NODE_16493_length_310_cov_0.965517_g15326_i0~~NODE_16493_length_310_cov_0.965517_g15326_i0.p3  ORF type:complete len:62 (-),score=13.71 NODE_16493_length_310_cov_0.965517_g15326_i0:15-200(-)